LKILGIDPEKCTNCGQCVKVCPSRLYNSVAEPEKNKPRVVFADSYNLCVRCGHCIAICPAEAILFEDADEPLNFEGTKQLEKLIPYETMLQALRMRRSIRLFKDQVVEKEEITKVLEAMRYAPSASNRQNWRYVVLTNKEEIAFLSREVSRFFKTARKLLPFRILIAPFLSPATRRRALNPKTKITLDRELARLENGEDIIFFNAPCVILHYSRDYPNGLADNDAGIALTYGMLAAQSLGLGSCWIGFAQIRLQKKRKLQKHFAIPKGYKVRGVLILGYPAVRYLRAPPRRPLRVRWIE